jgi:fermentation-respiration switch protein FrsA (DUF1100 family)
LIGHGRRDALIPFEMGQRLAKEAAGRVTTLWIDGAEHNDFYEIGSRQIDEAVAAFVRRLVPESP